MRIADLTEWHEEKPKDLLYRRSQMEALNPLGQRLYLNLVPFITSPLMDLLNDAV
ncbi:hypothetical protein [Nostoc sp. FACHB-145]|uniref:hypothetical protein n=1 Tax=Nostoc sp. FACHB-145 TaxID=2692836 RepID=UPI001687A8FF|nr:hypothetical protein [Nostoc sp. FACHB-145]MBD2471514.1 hypothetical protein [Nostoc sp. FACHB-145]